MSGPRIAIVCVGKLKESFYKSAADEYKKRLSRYAKLEIIELPDEPVPASLSDAQISKALEREGERILAKLSPNDFIVPLCIEGKRYTSEGFASAMLEWTAERRLVFVIGGSCGLCQAVVGRGNERLSLSDMTFPHRLARVVLLEQLYRAFKINSSQTYHK